MARKWGNVQFRLPRSPPIHEQVQDGLRHLIITGSIPAGSKLPPVRATGRQLEINSNTIQRAYGHFEREGYIYSVPGKGNFAALPQDVTDKRREELLTKLDAVVRELVYLGLNPSDIAEIVGINGNVLMGCLVDTSHGDDSTEMTR